MLQALQKDKNVLPSTRRLLKESSDLHKNPSPYFTAAPISDTNLHDWHFTLAGPPSPSPYAQGLYHGRITFPATYPLRPPSFRFLTPSGRFEVNREICLSISGHHEETWQPAWGVPHCAVGDPRGIEVEGGIAALDGSAGVDAGVDGQRETVEAEAEAAAPASGGNAVPVGSEHQARGGDAVESTPALESASAPSASASVPVAQPQPQAPLSTVQTPATAVMPTRTRSSHLASTESPSEGVWLDRAIIVVIIALVLLILRRVANVDDL
ncbi:hypothetical protein N7519_005362 [Penicillium mononematosum]|uniref:uncharacterized protein n=1 Tax=Penicillium mononematosum TaxID=268346 RepID=UPI0025468E97|nr:uncharacterized protein N7519_005362 [Penicillium mononematosum]KAJ6184061.1 hypothetical protein N7519_005362 [Penicillium mononematosum]